MLKTLLTEVKTELETLKTSGVLGDVKWYFTTNVTSYPCALFEPASNLLSNSELTTCENERIYGVVIYLVYPHKENEREDAVWIVSDAFDEVVELFDKNWTLNNKATRLEATQWVWTTIDWAKWQALVAEVNLKIHVLSYVM